MSKTCQYCGLPIFEPFAYHERGDCHEAMKLLVPELQRMANLLVSTDWGVCEYYPNTWEELEMILNNLRDKGFI